MIEITPEGFKILIRIDGSRQFMVDSERLDESIAYLRKHGLKFIGINSYLGYKRKDIDFLKDLKDFVEGLTVHEDHFDTAVVNDLHLLKSLGFADNKTNKIDLSNFPQLTTLACEVTPRLVALESCVALRHITLSRFRPKCRNLTELPSLSSLEELNVFQTSIVSLDGVEKFKNLKRASIFKASWLTNIDNLGHLSHSINELEIDTCKRVSNYKVLGRLQRLTRLIATNSGEILSLDFVRNLNELKFLSFVGTNVKDGDLSPCVGINYVGFVNKRHYNMKFEEFQTLDS